MYTSNSNPFSTSLSLYLTDKSGKWVLIAFFNNFSAFDTVPFLYLFVALFLHEPLQYFLFVACVSVTVNCLPHSGQVSVTCL